MTHTEYEVRVRIGRTHLVALAALGAGRDNRVVADGARSHSVVGHLAKKGERPFPLLANLRSG